MFLPPALAVVTLCTTFLPWGRSGERARNSYEIIDVVGDAGVLPDHLAGPARAWLLLPIVTGVALLLAAVGLRRWAATVAGIVGATAAVGAVVVQRSPLVAEPGTYGAIASGVVTLSISVVVLGARPSRKPHHE